MWRHWTAHAPTWAALFVMALIFAVFAAVIGPDLKGPPARVPARPASAIFLPPDDQDADNDTYPDDVDLWDGDLVVHLELDRLSVPGGDRARPYLLVGTQDDHWRTGSHAELEWRHVVDHDPLGRSPGSPDWIDESVRTGIWWRSLPLEDETHAMAETDSLEPKPETPWPHRFYVNVRDDLPVVDVEVEAWDARDRPHANHDAWTLEVDVMDGRWRFEEGPWTLIGNPASSVDPRSDVDVEFTLDLQTEIHEDTKEEVAARWAPVLMFDGEEQFFPGPGDTLERFHGFSDREGDLRTWTRDFNNGRDGYRLLLADFTGDGSVSHEDAAVLYEVLRAGDVATDTVYANVVRTTGGHVVVQYWFVYMYNFVLDETGRDVRQLAHAGDREFMQLVFEDLDAARNGTPLRAAYSQHYGGMSTPVQEGEPPFHLDPQRPVVFIAQGTHASYPAAGTDAALRNSLQGFGDVFFGDGETWSPEDYELEVLGRQTWHAGYLWGPLTRHSRDMGTAARPLLQHGFSYPFFDPLHWETTLTPIEADRLLDLYGGQR